MSHRNPLPETTVTVSPDKKKLAVGAPIGARSSEATSSSDGATSSLELRRKVSKQSCATCGVGIPTGTNRQCDECLQLLTTPTSLPTTLAPSTDPMPSTLPPLTGAKAPVLAGVVPDASDTTQQLLLSELEALRTVVGSTREAALSELQAQRSGFKAAATEYEQMTADQLAVKTAQWKNRYHSLENHYNGALSALQASQQQQHQAIRSQLEIQVAAAKTEMAHLKSVEDSVASNLRTALSEQQQQHQADMAASSATMRSREQSMQLLCLGRISVVVMVSYTL